MQNSATEESLLQQEYKLCGFLRVVLSLNSPPPPEELSDTLPFATYCYLSDDERNELGFRTEGNLTLSLLQTDSDSQEQEPQPHSNTNSDVSTPDSGKRKAHNQISRYSHQKLRRFGFVNGKMSVVHQIHDLKMRRCIEIVARVLAVSYRSSVDARVVLLIDVYLPLALWTGWQFPKSGAVAAALFRHLSCDWKQRSVILVDGKNYCTFKYEDSENIWRNSDCHILGCEVHCNVPGSSKKRLFELHEIFRSLPSIAKDAKMCSTRIIPESALLCPGIWDVSDDILINILTLLGPIDLVRVASTCRHLRSLAEAIMPCMKLTLYPHQQAAIEWMLQRERNTSVMMHPLYMDFSTEDGFHFYIHAVSGEIVTGVAPTYTDFRGGMFCDEPGLGKTITALSLILKTQGTLADAPNGVDVIWCTHNNDTKCGYYELNAGSFTPGNVKPSRKRFIGQNGRWGQNSSDNCSPVGVAHSKRARSLGSSRSCPSKLGLTSSSAAPLHFAKGPLSASTKKEVKSSSRFPNGCKRHNKGGNNYIEHKDNWVQCDSCRKWRRIVAGSIPETSRAWFCSMNADPLHQICDVPEEPWDDEGPITYLPGFCTKGTSGGNEMNVTFFTGVLKENYMLMDLQARKALDWLCDLSEDKLLEMETVGLTRPVLSSDSDGPPPYRKIFQAFGLISKVQKGVTRWYYPFRLENMIFDVTALQMALTQPLDVFRLYLSRATLIVVPPNLVDHWKTQIYKHVKPDQLRVYVWTDHRKPSAHSLAWDNDIVITTFNRLSAEWGPQKRSPLMQVHWLRVMLDEGHTLGSSFSLTNKLQMAISLTASNRWLLTGTPTPNIPNSQVSHLQPLLKFLHEEAYGQNHKSWEAGILRPFEAEMEEGRSRLLQLLQRCMISARKEDLKSIPTCIKKVVFLDFTEEHARSYNELAVTVRRNILMADWNDPSHVESILNPKQWKFRSTLIRNVRLSCCVAGHIKVAEAGDDVQETMDILVDQGLDQFSEEYVFIKLSLQHGCNCLRCKEWCRLPFVTPCRHLLCLDCVAMDSEKCTFPGCGNPYEMQSPETLARPENPNPKWPVPKDLIELQPSYKQDDWDPDWHATSSSKVSYLVERLKKLQEANRMNRTSSSNVDIAESDGTHRLLSQKSPCNTFVRHGACTRKEDAPSRMAPEKVIIFSQFLEHIHVIEQQLAGSGINFVGMYSPMHASNKMKSLTTFQLDETCMVLLMDGSAALGLDLSFVTHVFLMEPIWDGSMEEQVISRAHRMGATRPINVETLAMRGTIEEQMLNFLKDTGDCRQTLKEEFGKNTEREGARSHRTLHDFAESNYLQELRFVHVNSKA